MPPSTLRYEDTKVDPEAWKKLKKELGETRDSRKKGLEVLRKKLSAAEGLVPRLDEDFLLSFLRVSKFNASKAFQRILNYYDIKNRYLELMPGSISPSRMRLVEKARQLYICPYRLPDNSAILIQKRTEYDSNEIPLQLVFQSMFALSEVITQHPLSPTCGFHVILDLSSNLRTSWTEYTPTLLKVVAKCLQNAVPARSKGIHILYAPTIFHFLYGIIYPFLSTKIRNRVFLHKDHGNWKTLHEKIAPEFLPEEYGGYLDHSELINVYDKMEKMEEYFRKNEQYGFVRK